MRTGSPLTTQDFLLLACSIACLVACWWPGGPPQQVVQVDSGRGQPQRYLVAVNDPRLPPIRRGLLAAARVPSCRAVRRARWHLEIAAHYAELTAPPVNSPIAQVSHVVTEASNPATGSFSNAHQQADDHQQDSARQSAHAYWKRRQAAAAAWLQREQSHSRHLRETGRSPAIQLGPVVSAPKSWRGIACGIVTGALLAAVVGWRQHVRPPLTPQCEETFYSPSRRPDAISVGIAAEWVRIKQPLEVRFRRWLLVGSATAAATSAVFLGPWT